MTRPNLTRDHLSSTLEEMSFFSELAGENPFKVRAFQKAARTVSHLSKDEFDRHLQNKTLMDLDGIGKGVMSVVEDLAHARQPPELTQWKKKYPDSLWELASVPGLGPKRVKILFEHLAVSSRAELEYACLENRLTLLKGFGEKTQTKILSELQHLKSLSHLYSGPAMREEWLLLKGRLEEEKRIYSVKLVGELARLCDVVESIDLLIHTQKDVSEESLNKWLKTESGIPVRPFLLQGSKNFCPFAMELYLTSHPAHWTGLQNQSKKRKLSLEKTGLVHPQKKLRVDSIQDIYESLGFHFTPPELRESEMDLHPTSAPNPFLELVTMEDAIGAYHNHTTESDGSATLEEMIQEALRLKWRWIGISDHSQSAFYANGLNPKRLKEQHEEVLKLRKKYTQIKILHGVESDILPNGDLDYPDSELQKLDFVIASVHSHMNQDSSTMTRRLCQALSHPKTTALGHPTGRILLGRKGFQFDWDEVFETARKHKKAIELNANPHRLDIDWRILRQFRSFSNVKIAISPDAHSTLGMADIQWGYEIARKGYVKQTNLLNPLN